MSHNLNSFKRYVGIVRLMIRILHLNTMKTTNIMAPVCRQPLPGQCLSLGFWAGVIVGMWWLDLGFRAEGLGLRVWGLGFKGLEVEGNPKP